MARGVIHPQGVTLSRVVPYVGAPEIKVRRLVLAIRYRSHIGNPGLSPSTSSNARSVLGEADLTMAACADCPLHDTSILSAFSTTWWAVRRRPSGWTTNAVPEPRTGRLPSARDAAPLVVLKPGRSLIRPNSVLCPSSVRSMASKAAPSRVAIPPTSSWLWCMLDSVHPHTDRGHQAERPT